MKKVLFTILLFAGALPPLIAQQYHFFARISMSEGLASNHVYSIAQDEKGFFWVATDNGLQRFDGQSWMSPSATGSDEVLSRPIHQLYTQRRSLIMKCGQNYFRFNTSNFTIHPIRISAELRGSEHVLWQDSRGRIFLIDRGYRLLSYDSSNNVFSGHLPFAMPPGFHPYTVFEDTANSRYWIGGKEGIVVWDAERNKVYTGGNNPQNLPLLNDGFREVSSLFIDNTGNHWVVHGLQQQRYAAYSAGRKKFLDNIPRLENYYKGRFSIHGFFETTDKQFWLFGTGALFNYMPAIDSFYNTKADVLNSTGPRFGRVMQMLQDRENGVWVATDEGLYLFYVNLPEVRSLVFRADNDNNNFTDVTELPGGQLWMSSLGKGVIAADSFRRRVNLKALFDRVPAADLDAVKNTFVIHRHVRSNTLFLGAAGGIILKVDPKQKTCDYIKLPAQAAANVKGITESPSGDLYFGTDSGAVFYYNQFAPFEDASFRKIADVGSSVNDISADHLNRLWICSGGGGVFCIDAGTGRQIARYHKGGGSQQKLSSDYTSTIAQLNDSVWAVASDVLNIINTSSGIVRHLSRQDGLIGNTIRGMQRDSRGFLWIATSNGVCRYSLQRNRFSSYDEKDGFIRFENLGVSTALLSDKRLLFVGSNALVSFPVELYRNSRPPRPVTITDIRVMENYLPIDSVLALDRAFFAPSKNSVAINFASISYFLKDKLTYYYRLKNIDPGWRSVGRASTAVYSLLPPGEYDFEVKCENEEGISSPITTFMFYIQPPFWRSWWFFALVLAAVAALLFYFHRLRVNKILAVSELRSRVARDLHDDVGSTLSTISILSTMARARLNENARQAAEYIDKISDNSQQMMESMDDIVWSIKPMNDSMQKIIARMREVASGALEPKDIDIDFYVDQKVYNLKLNMEARRDLFLIYKEAINNIAKYSQCSHVLIHISYVRNRLLLKIKDNGVGFDIDHADSGNGLSNMKKRAAMMNARIKLHSQERHGSQVLLNMPIN